MFSDLDEMDKVMIENWNKKVKSKDTVIITGDMFYRNQVPAHEYLERLNGRKILVKGNHDQSWLKNYTLEERERYFEFIGDFYRIKQNGFKIYFCHYPMLSWESSRYGSLLVCGHIHGRMDNIEAKTFKDMAFAFNAGVDVNGFYPVSLGELIKNNFEFYQRQYTDSEKEHLNSVLSAFGEKAVFDLL
jgi:calcineurin-like phosphoesterase family protein